MSYVYSSRCRAVGTAMTSPLAQSNTFEFIEYVITQPLKRSIAKQWADFVCITCQINVCVLKELFRVDPSILELLTTPTCRQVQEAHLSDQLSKSPLICPFMAFHQPWWRACALYVHIIMHAKMRTAYTRWRQLGEIRGIANIDDYLQVWLCDCDMIRSVSFPLV